MPPTSGTIRRYFYRVDESTFVGVFWSNAALILNSIRCNMIHVCRACCAVSVLPLISPSNQQCCGTISLIEVKTIIKWLLHYSTWKAYLVVDLASWTYFSRSKSYSTVATLCQVTTILVFSVFNCACGIEWQVESRSETRRWCMGALVVFYCSQINWICTTPTICKQGVWPYSMNDH